MLNPTERAQVLLKTSTRDFQNSPPFERSTCFYRTISESFKRFQYFNFETHFLENKSLFQKTGVPFLVETTKIEDTSFPFKTTLSEAIFKTNRIATTKWTYHKEWSFASSYFISLENLFEFLNLSVRVNLMYQRFKCPYSYFS